MSGETLIAAHRERVAIRTLAAAVGERNAISPVPRVSEEAIARAAFGRFRKDLYYRISGVEITLPPLRQRREDIPALVRHFLTLAAERAGRPIPELTRQALEALTLGAWPGNVRELEHVVARAVVLSDGSRLTARDFEIPQATDGAPALDRQRFEHQEASQIAAALASNRFNVSKVARILGIPRATLWRKMKRYGLCREKD